MALTSFLTVGPSNTAGAANIAVAPGTDTILGAWTESAALTLGEFSSPLHAVYTERHIIYV